METLVNFRDLGLYTTQDGKKVKENRIFRSGELVGLSQEDIKLLTHTYRIKIIYDFRNQEEVVERPDDTIEGIEYRHIDIMKDAQGNSTSFSDMSKNSLSAEEMMMRVYEDLLTAQYPQKGYKEFLESLVVEDNASIVFHCFAGKDRTGIGAALILGILNVSTEDIFKDYLLTNQQRKSANDRILNHLRQLGTDEKEIERVSIMLSVKKEYLEHAFHLIKDNYGDIPGYVRGGLGFSESFIKDMRSIYTM